MPIVTNTKIGIISNALVCLGEAPATSLTENRNGVTIGANLFEQIYEAELTACRWRFSCTKVQLAQLVAEPLNEWQHAFQLPSDMLLPIGVLPSCSYEIYGDHLYANNSTIYLDYQFKPEITDVPSYFALMLTYSMAMNMAKPVTESDSHASKWQNLYLAQRARAMYADAQGRPNKQIRSNPFVNARRSGFR